MSTNPLASMPEGRDYRLQSIEIENGAARR
jgi:hypothetical protein